MRDPTICAMATCQAALGLVLLYFAIREPDTFLLANSMLWLGSGTALFYVCVTGNLESIVLWLIVIPFVLSLPLVLLILFGLAMGAI